MPQLWSVHPEIYTFGSVHIVSNLGATTKPLNNVKKVQKA